MLSEILPVFLVVQDRLLYLSVAVTGNKYWV